MSRITWSIVRPLVTLAFAGALVAGFFTELIPSETAVPIFASAITWWFTSRDAARATEKPVLPVIVPPIEPPKE